MRKRKGSKSRMSKKGGMMSPFEPAFPLKRAGASRKRGGGKSR